MRTHGILVALLLSACATTTAQTPTQTQDQAAQIDALFSSIRSDGPGCVIGVKQDGKTVIEKAYGLAVLEHNVPVTTSTLFEIGSVSKQFTAAAILLLEKDGKLQLDADIRRYLPEMPGYETPITVEMLLDHRSGLRDWGSVANAAGKPRGERNFTNTEVLDIAARQMAVNYTPGSAYSYTNTGYNLAATIVERVSGQSFMAFTKERMFDPLGMTSAQWRDDFNRIVKGRAMAYAASGDGFEQSMPFMDVYGNGGLIMTNGDLTRWNEAMMTDELGIRAGMEKQAALTDGRKLPYARGVNVAPYNGVTEVYHGGVTGGYNAWLSRFPDRKLSIAMTCNTSPPRAATPAALAGVFFGPAPQTVAATGLPDPARYAGLFVDTRTGLPWNVSSNAGELQLNNRPVIRVSETQWKRGADTYTFLSADKLQIEAFDGNLHELVRTPAVGLPVSMYGEYAGSYTSDETRATYRISVESGLLTLKIEGWPDAVLTLASAYRDAFMSNGALIRFRRGPDGKVNEMSLGDSRMWDLRAVRVK